MLVKDGGSLAFQVTNKSPQNSHFAVSKIPSSVAVQARCQRGDGPGGFGRAPREGVRGRTFQPPHFPGKKGTRPKFPGPKEPPAYSMRKRCGGDPHIATRPAGHSLGIVALEAPEQKPRRSRALSQFEIWKTGMVALIQ